MSFGGYGGERRRQRSVVHVQRDDAGTGSSIGNGRRHAVAHAFAARSGAEHGDYAIFKRLFHGCFSVSGPD
jgi:hypothetical protein